MKVNRGARPFERYRTNAIGGVKRSAMSFLDELRQARDALGTYPETATDIGCFADVCDSAVSDAGIDVLEEQVKSDIGGSS